MAHAMDRLRYDLSDDATLAFTGLGKLREITRRALIGCQDDPPSGITVYWSRGVTEAVLRKLDDYRLEEWYILLGNALTQDEDNVPTQKPDRKPTNTVRSERTGYQFHR